MDAGPAEETGHADAGPKPDAGSTVIPTLPEKTGCGCQAGGLDVAWLGFGVLALRRRRW